MKKRSELFRLCSPSIRCSAMAGIPRGEIKNDRNRNTPKPSFSPLISRAILIRTPIPETTCKRAAA